MKKYKQGTFIRTEDNRSGFITGSFENEHGIFYQMDNSPDIMTFPSHEDIISIAAMTTVIRKPKRARNSRKSLGKIPVFEEKEVITPEEWVDSLDEEIEDLRPKNGADTIENLSKKNAGNKYE